MFTTFKTNREMTYEELQEVMGLMANQETTDKFANCNMDINGEYAHIEVTIDIDGNVTLL